MSGHILIVEDDENIARMVEATLELGGYTSEVSADGSSALALIQQREYDLVLLDVMLPQLDGFDVLAEMTHRQRQIPVIFLTAVDEVSKKVRGLRMGAEDYIVKPFEAVELLARIDVVLRRTQRGAAGSVCFDGICVDIDAHQVLHNGQLVQLTPKEFDLLVFFIQNTDIALTRERLLSAVWGHHFLGETRTVDTHVQQLRKKLALAEALVTIPRLGYRLEGSG
ncbi:MAG: response regulator transcription factor [Coriobacteriales bacterium]|nr:response regulator transcription factor [Coriobacteriales bacterium]